MTTVAPAAAACLATSRSWDAGIVVPLVAAAAGAGRCRRCVDAGDDDSVEVLMLAIIVFFVDAARGRRLGKERVSTLRRFFVHPPCVIGGDGEARARAR
jgi:hypothetical protein